ncbi:MAG: type II toxin-antitoxin system HicA family toxin [Armatimonadetes bacterium]|nr:type II toxin-antitoxin system HicA family toxin [Armatimonadota bacterium]
MKAYSGREIIRLLRSHGWQIARVEGSHHILTKPGRDETISVPVHGNHSLKSGIVHFILGTAGIRPE